MSLKSVKNVEKNLASLEILIPREDFDAAVKKAYHKNVGKINVPGFRKGKAPQGIIEKMYGKTVFYDDAIDDVFPAVYTAAVEEAGLDVVSRPEIELGSDDENGVVIVTRVYLKPEVKVGNYKGYELTKKAVAVTDADIDTEIEMVRKRNSRVITIEDRPLANGDTAKFDFEGFVDGVAFEGGKASDYPLTIGSGAFIPGFEDQLIGANIDEEKEINVTFPEEYQAKELAGKAAVFKCTVHSIKAKELPELDDEFVSDVSEKSETVDAYKAEVKAKIKERKENEGKQKREDQSVEQAVANAEMDIPEAMISFQSRQMVDDFARRIMQQGMTMEQYFQFTGLSEEKMMEEFKPEAEKRIRTRLTLEAIVAAENIEVSEERLDEELQKMADSYKMEVDKLKEYMGENEKKQMKEDIAIQEAVTLIANAAVEG